MQPARVCQIWRSQVLWVVEVAVAAASKAVQLSLPLRRTLLTALRDLGLEGDQVMGYFLKKVSLK